MIEGLEAKARHYDALAEDYFFQDRHRLAALYRSLARAAWRLSWMNFRPPYTAQRPKPKHRHYPASRDAGQTYRKGQAR